VEDSGIAQILKVYFVEEILEGPVPGLTLETPLLEWGLLTSLSTMRLLSFINERFGVQVPAEEVVGKNLQDLGSIARLVGRLTEPPPAGAGSGRTAEQAGG
jgi:acyl carrier protein